MSRTMILARNIDTFTHQIQQIIRLESLRITINNDNILHYFTMRYLLYLRSAAGIWSQYLIFANNSMMLIYCTIPTCSLYGYKIDFNKLTLPTVHPGFPGKKYRFFHSNTFDINFGFIYWILLAFRVSVS